jgi:uncharacterized protein with ATP-grasp and redox domains
MDPEPQCVICLFRLASRAVRSATDDPQAHGQVIDQLADEMPRMPEGTISPQIGRRIQQIVRDVTGNGDPFRDSRRRSNELALGHLPELRRRVERAEDPLLEAIRLAVAGNIIDLAVGSEFNLERAIDDCLSREFSIFDYESFRAAVGRSRRVLLIADNAGEIVFDRLLVEELLRRGLRVIVAVRGGPAINDALREDASRAGFDPQVEIIDTGSDLPSVVLSECGEEFLRHYRDADLVVAKGQGNYEGLRHESGPITFLLMAKCRPVARWLGVEQGDLVLSCGAGGKTEP